MVGCPLAKLDAHRVEIPDAAPRQMRDRIAAAVDEFTAGAPQKDDQTMVIARSI